MFSFLRRKAEALAVGVIGVVGYAALVGVGTLAQGSFSCQCFVFFPALFWLLLVSVVISQAWSDK